LHTPGALSNASLGRRTALPNQKEPQDPEVGTAEAASQTVSVIEPTIPVIPVRLISPEDLLQKVETLRDMPSITNDKGEIEPFEGPMKDAFISVVQDTCLVIEQSLNSMYELGNLFFRARRRLGHYKVYSAWLKLIECPTKVAKQLIKVYERYGERLHQFSDLGLEKLSIVARLDDCAEYVESHEKDIAVETLGNLRQRVRILDHYSRYEYYSKVKVVEGATPDIQRLYFQFSFPRPFLSFIHIEYTKDFARVASQSIIESNPDLLIINARPFHELGSPHLDGIDIVEQLRRRSKVPVIFYSAYENLEKMRGEIGSRLAALKPAAFLRMPLDLKEMLRTVHLTIQANRAEKKSRWAYGDLEKLVSARTKQLTAANEQLRNEVQARKAAEEVALRSQRRLQAVFDCATDAIFIKDGSLRYQMVNPALADLLNREEPEILGKTDADFFEQGVAEHFREVDRRVLQGEAVEEQYSRSIRGVEMTFLDSRVPLRDGLGQVVGICGFSRDISDRQKISLEEITIDDEYNSPAMRACVKQALVAAGNDSIVLLLGESGSGKDHLARYIHEHSKRAGGPYFSINCAAVAPELAEGELFGHERGAFTGAHSRKRGLLELAEGGTLLLNEIGELSFSLQAKLLTFLETKKFTRVGGEREVEVNARLMAATNRNLESAVKDGSFRKDLFYRLNVLPIIVPLLRERRADIPVLVKQIVHKLREELQLAEQPIITPATMKAFLAYSWPGNVRELRNVLERALILSKGGPITPDLLGFQNENIGKERTEENDKGTLGDNDEKIFRPLRAVEEPELDLAREAFYDLPKMQQGYHLDFMVNQVCGGKSGAVKCVCDLMVMSNKTLKGRLKSAGVHKKIDTGNPELGARERMVRKLKAHLVNEILKATR